MASASKIATRTRSFLVGLALWTKDGTLDVVKTFSHTDENDADVRDFLRIITETSLYRGGNEIIEISKKHARNLLTDFGKHDGTLKFLMSVGKHGGIIVVMHQRRIPKNYEEAAIFAAHLKPKVEKSNKKKKKMK